MRFLSIIFLFLSFLHSQRMMAQEEEESQTIYDSTAMSSPGLRYQQRPKFFVVSYDRIFETPAISNSEHEEIGDGFARLRKVEQILFKLKFPLKWKGRTKFFTGINYSYQEYNFVQADQLSYDFYKALENRHLNSLSTQLYATHSFKRYRFLVSRLGAELNGDYRNDPVSTTRFLRVSASVLYGWNKREDLSYGFGFYWNYDFGGPSIYPVFLYNRNFSEKFGIEAVFPKEVFLRWNPTDGNIFYAGYEVSGSTFQLVFEDPHVYPASTLQLQRSNIRPSLRWERRVHDFIWVGLNTGFHFTVNMDLSDENWFYSLDRELIDTRFGPTPFAQFQVFLVPPTKLAKRALNPE